MLLFRLVGRIPKLQKVRQRGVTSLFEIIIISKKTTNLSLLCIL